MYPRPSSLSFARWLAGALLLLPVAILAQEPTPNPAPTDDEIRAILRARVDVEKRGVGIVVGWVDAQGSRVVSYGKTALQGGTEVNGRTIFEIGSVTKVFTATLLARAVERGDLKLDDPVAKYLPPGMKVPSVGDVQITLLDLATHRSGLPSMPNNIKPKDDANPYADYTLGQLNDFLAAYTLKRDIGNQYEYSNLGFGLLGQALARRAGVDYEKLVVASICDPLGMADTRITLTPELTARLAQPHDGKLAPTHSWELPVFAGAGALRSDANDLLKFVAANLEFTRSGLTTSLLAAQQVRNSAGSSAMDIALAWHIAKTNPPPITWHNGGTGGYHSFVGFDSARRRGVVVLSNTTISVDDIGMHLLNAKYPLSEPPRVHTAIPLKPEVTDAYVGRYQLAPDFILTFSREGDRYYLGATGQGKNEVFPETPSDFFIKEANIQISFVKDPAGKVTDLILHQGGDQRAPRLP